MVNQEIIINIATNRPLTEEEMSILLHDVGYRLQGYTTTPPAFLAETEAKWVVKIPEHLND
jgi:hypothetical protein